MTDITVTESMKQAALDRLNKLGGGERDPDGTVAMYWGDIIPEIYRAMEERRRADIAASLLHATGQPMVRKGH